MRDKKGGIWTDEDELSSILTWCYSAQGALAWLWLNHGKEHFLVGYNLCTDMYCIVLHAGRTGHWLNHSKEHCLVGYKGSAAALNRRVDCDVVVADVSGGVTEEGEE